MYHANALLRICTLLRIVFSLLVAPTVTFALKTRANEECAGTEIHVTRENGQKKFDKETNKNVLNGL